MIKPSPGREGGFTRSLVLLLAQGFGLGRIPWAPGTFGSLAGLGWFAILLLIAQGSPIAAGVLLAGSIVASAWTCEAAEIILGTKDPGSVVLDEIVALPTCFAGWVALQWWQQGAVPAVEEFFSGSTWYLTAGVFLAFRCFDIVKPSPVLESQSVPGGWGVVLDDQLAAVYVNLAVLAGYVALQAAR
jgi:phosphatidylglycerophosphatase A